MFSCLFVNIMRFFSCFFPAEFVGFLFFPRNARFFPKSGVFRGSCGKRIVLPCFSQYFCIVEETRQRRNGSVILKHLLHYIIMNAQIMRVVKQGEAFAVQSQKSENGQMMKCNIILQELGGKYENQYAAAMLGNMAQCKFAPGTLVAVTLRFMAHEYNGQVYQDILVTDIEKLGK